LGDLDLGLRFVVEPLSTSLSDEERRLLSDLRPAGVMFRKRNFIQDAPYHEWLGAFDTLLSDIRRAVGRDALMISIDHEGGRVHRFPPPITRFPYPAFYSGSPDAIESVARAMGIELRSLGFNVSFSPVTDIHSNPSNPVINQRAFGRTATEVAERAALFAKGLQAEGILPCIKHFPGHGDTATDSHYALPVVLGDLSELTAREFYPFAAIIQEGIQMVMSAHIMLPQVDPDNQATLSRRILTDILRGQLGFNGVIIADALGMQAIRSEVSTSSFAERAHEAGIDLFLMVGDPVSIRDAVACRDSLRLGLVSGNLSESSLRQSETRIANVLSALGNYDVEALPADTILAHLALSERLIGNSEWEEFEIDLKGFD
jgi:beta-N-acetylhexosaminidase